MNAYYVWDTTNNCRFATPVNGTADLGAFHVHRRPEIYFFMRDRNENLLKGAELDVTGPDGVTLHLLAKPARGTVTTTAWGQQPGKRIVHNLALMPPTNPF